MEIWHEFYGFLVEEERKIKPLWPKIKNIRLGQKNLPTQEILHLFQVFREKERRIYPKIKKSAWAQKTSEIATFAIGIQQWKSCMIFWFLGEKERKIKPFLPKIEKVRLGPKHL